VSAYLTVLFTPETGCRQQTMESRGQLPFCMAGSLSAEVWNYLHYRISE